MSFASQLSAAFTPIAAVYDEASTTRALTWAQSFVTSFCDETFDLVVDDVVFLNPARYRTALLPQVPVVSVSSVLGYMPTQNSAGGGMAWVQLQNYNFVAATGLLYDTTGEPGVYGYNLGPTWPTLPGSLQVTYTHGYPVVPQPVVDVACRLAQQYLENPTLELERRVGDVADRYAGTAGICLNEMDKVILGRYTRVTVG